MTLFLVLVLFAVCASYWGAYLAEYDEGPVVQAAALANRGYRLYTEVAANKPPLLVWWVQLAFKLGGESLAVARLAVSLVTLIGGVALAALVAHDFGMWAGPMALLALLAMPGLVPRMVCVTHDLPAASLAVVALWAAERYRRAPAPYGGAAWPALAGAALGLATGVHPLMAVAALPVAAVLAKPGLKVRSLSRWLRPLLIAGGAGVITVAAWLLPVASQAFLIWVFGYNSATLGPGLTAMAQANEARIWTYFVRDHLAVTVATLLSVVALFAGRRRRLLTAVMAGWLLMSVGVISLLRPMWEHYLLLPLLPAAGLIGGGGALAIAWIAAEMRAATATAETAPRPPATASRWRAVWAAMGAVALVLVGTQFAKAPHKRPPWPAEDLALRHYLESQTPPGAFVLTDQPLVAFISGRLVPPPLADTSAKRVSTRSMDTAAVMNALLRYDPACLAFAYGRLNRLQPLVAWAEAHATEVVMPDDPFSGLRVFRLTPVGKPAVPLDVQVGAVMRLIGYRLGAAGAEQADGIVPAGEPLSVTLYWQVGDVRLTKAPEARAADPGAGQAPNGAAGADREKPRADAHIFIHIVNAAGDIVAQADAPPMDGALRTVDLEPGVVVPLAVGPVELAPGRYTVRAGMYTWPDQVRLPAVLGSGEKAPDDLIPVAALQVVGP